MDAWRKVDPNPEVVIFPRFTPGCRPIGNPLSFCCPPQESARNINLHAVADIAWVAAKAGAIDLARKCAVRANASQVLLAKPWSLRAWEPATW